MALRATIHGGAAQPGSRRTAGGSDHSYRQHAFRTRPRLASMQVRPEYSVIHSCGRRASGTQPVVSRKHEIFELLLNLSMSFCQSDTSMSINEIL